MSTDLDAEWIYTQLQIDAALVTSLVLQGRSVEADAHLEACNYRGRLAEWQRLTGKKVTTA